MARCRQLFFILAVVICLADGTNPLAYLRERCSNECKENPGSNKKCNPCILISDVGLGKRSFPRFPNAAAYVRDQIQYREPMAQVPSDSCQMLDIYRAVAPSCHAKLNWLVSKAEEALLNDE